MAGAAVPGPAGIFGAVAPNDKVDHKCICDYCDKHIYGYRYKCLECHNYDLCSKCFEARKCSRDHESRHVVARFVEAGRLAGISFDENSLYLDYFVKKFESEVHSNVKCDVCNTRPPIRGIRLKCDSCPNLNVCFKCKNSHTPSHPLVIYPKTNTNEIEPSDVTVGRELGKGAFGTVHEGVYKNKKVACKTLTLSPMGIFFGMDIDVLEESYTRELQAYNEIKGVNILRMIGHCSVADGMGGYVGFMILTELAAKGDLASVVTKETDMTYRRRFDIAAGIALGTARIHQLRFIHRDIRPANIFVTNDYVPKIGDMGIAKLIKNPKELNTVVGPIPYMPPEFYSGHYNQKLDVFTVGLTLNEVFGGVHYPGYPDIEIVQKAPPAIWNLISRCVNLKPVRRPTSKEFSLKLSFLNSQVSNTINQNKEYSLPTTSREKRNTIFGQALATANNAFQKEQDTERARRAKESNIKLLDYFKSQLKTWKVFYGNTDGPDVAAHLRHIGIIYSKMNETKMALDFFNKSREMFTRLYGKDHLDISDCLTSIAWMYFNQLKDRENALSFEKEAYEMRKRLLAANHKKLAESLFNLGIFHANLADDKAALDHYQKSLDMWKRLFPDGYSANVLETLQKLEACYKKMKDATNAQRIGAEVTRVKRELNRRNIGNNLRIPGLPANCSEADGPVLNYLFDKLKRLNKLSNQKDDVCVTRQLLLIVYYYNHLKDPVNCLLYASKCVEMSESVFPGKDNSLKADAYYVLGCCYLYMKKDARNAMENFGKAHATRSRLLKGKDHPRMAAVLYQMGSAHLKLGAQDDALNKYQAAIAMRKRLFDASNDLLLVSYLHKLEKFYLIRNESTNYSRTRQEGLKLKGHFFEKKHPGKKYAEVILLHFNGRDKPGWEYVMIKDETKYQASMIRNGERNLRVAEFGEVVKRGDGMYPTKAARDEIAQKYGWE